WLLYYPLDKMTAKHTDTLITINQDDFALAKEKFKIANIHLMHGVGVDFNRLECDVKRQDIRSELGLCDDDFILLSIGELNKNKNNISILRAIHKLNNPKLKYLIAGNGPLKSYLEQEIAQMGLSEQVKFLGYTREIGRYHKAADVFCFVSHREGLGLAAIEAMYSGLPLITSNIRGINDYSAEGVTGFKAAPGDVDKLAESIDKLMKSPELRETMGDHNKKAALIYSNEEAKKALEKIYF
ncbi:MAG: glycosyltransferase, partial [Clostridia bacterium]|nr:glycosyltransferase [Clostridia bacterium]